jgi:DNA-binding response OmpR family regulator
MMMPMDGAVGTTLPILVVEDNRRLLDVLGMMLEFEHFNFVLMADGQQALDWLATQRPSLVILDWALPKVHGGQVVRAIRAHHGAEVPILVLSAVADAEDARQAGVDGYLRKPYAIEDLLGTIRHLLTL